MINFIRHIFLLNGNGYQLIEWCRLYFETTKRSLLQISTSHSRSGAAQAWKLWLVLCKNWDMMRKMSKKTSWGNVFFLTVSMFTFQHQDNWCPRTGGVEMSVGAVLTRQDFNQKVSVSADSYITGTLYMRKWCMSFVFGPKLVQFNPDFSWSVRVEANKHICEIISGMRDFLNSKLLSLVWECNQQTLLEHKTRCCWDLDGVPAF